MRWWKFPVVLLALFCAGFAQGQDRAAPAPARQAGTIELVDGDAIIDSRTGASFRPAKAGEAVDEGETITTFGNAEVQLRMADGAQLSLRENSKITITAYVADGGSGDRILIELAKGAFRAITGWIGKFNPRNDTIRTPTATIGIRGTDHEPMYLLQGDPRGEPGTYDKVNEGGTFLRGAGGTVEVTPNRAAFHGSAPGARPQLLASVPAFFRPGRNEQRFVQRARETAPTLQKLRDNRIEAVRTARAKSSGATPAPVPRTAVPPAGAPPAAKPPAIRSEQNRPQKPAPAAKTQPAQKAAAQGASKPVQKPKPKPPARPHPAEKKRS